MLNGVIVKLLTALNSAFSTRFLCYEHTYIDNSPFCVCLNNRRVFVSVTSKTAFVARATTVDFDTYKGPEMTQMSITQRQHRPDQSSMSHVASSSKEYVGSAVSATFGIVQTHPIVMSNKAMQ